MRRNIIAAGAALCLALALFGGRASAEEAFRHSGLYAGIAGGYSTTALRTEDIDLAGQGAFGGAFLGFGQVIDGVYWGIELDGMLRDIRPSISDGTTTVTFKNDWTASGRVRLGLPLGPALLYGTGGVAVTQSKLSATDFGSDKQYIVGWVVGAGAELLTFKNMALRVEALHYQFPAEKFEIGGAEASIKQGETVARVGLSFKLN